MTPCLHYMETTHILRDYIKRCAGIFHFCVFLYLNSQSTEDSTIYIAYTLFCCPSVSGVQANWVAVMNLQCKVQVRNHTRECFIENCISICIGRYLSVWTCFAFHKCLIARAELCFITWIWQLQNSDASAESKIIHLNFTVITVSIIQWQIKIQSWLMRNN